MESIGVYWNPGLRDPRAAGIEVILVLLGALADPGILRNPSELKAEATSSETLRASSAQPVEVADRILSVAAIKSPEKPNCCHVENFMWVRGNTALQST